MRISAHGMHSSNACVQSPYPLYASFVDLVLTLRDFDVWMITFLMSLRGLNVSEEPISSGSCDTLDFCDFTDLSLCLDGLSGRGL